MRRRNTPPCRTTWATLLAALFTIFFLVLSPQPSLASPIPIPVPSTEQETPLNPFEPEHNRVVTDLQPSTYPGSNPSEPNNTPGSPGSGNTVYTSNNNSLSDGASHVGLDWSHLSSVFVNEICKTDGRAILLGFLIGCLGTWLIHILVQRYLLRRGWGLTVWPSRRTRRHWASRRLEGGNQHGDTNGEDVMTGGGDSRPDERNSNRRAEMGAV